METILLDGGLSNALTDRGVDLRGDLWTARLLRDEPAEIAAVHRAYFAAGADVVTTASYQASVEGFEAAGASRAEAHRLLTRSVSLAREVRDELATDGVRRRVAASVGPYGAALADGSEYRGRYGVPAATLRDFHARRLEILLAAGPDLIAVETVPDLDEAVVLAELLSELLPGAELATWFSFSTPDGERTAAGQPLTEAFAVAASAAPVVAVGVNCCPPEHVAAAVRNAAATTGLPGVGYPNRGQTWDADAKTWSDEGVFDATWAQEWVSAGAGYVGGCCQVGPDDIARLARTLAGRDRTSTSGVPRPG